MCSDLKKVGYVLKDDMLHELAETESRRSIALHHNENKSCREESV